MIDTIDNEIETIIAKSGNSFHCTVLNYFEKKGWDTLISPYYTDILSAKPREIDLIAEKTIDSSNNFRLPIGKINIKLFIECKYIPQKNVFWFHSKDKEKTKALVEKTIPSDHTVTENHHYLHETLVAKLFSDGKSKGIENEIFFKAINQTLNATIYYRNKKSIYKIKNNSPITETLIYPVIICNSFEHIYRINMGEDSKPYRINDNFLMEVNYAYSTPDGKNKDEYFLIDIIDFNKIEKFFLLIEEEVKMTGYFKKALPNMIIP